MTEKAHSNLINVYEQVETKMTESDCHIQWQGKMQGAQTVTEEI